MTTIQDELRETTRTLLAEGQVDCVLGWAWEEGLQRAVPCFVRAAEDAKRLIWDERCVVSLAPFLLHMKRQLSSVRTEPSRTAIVVKGCDARGVVRILRDQQLERDEVLIIGVVCQGVGDPDNRPAKCRECQYHVPPVYDLLLGEEPKETQTPSSPLLERVREIEGWDVADRASYWREHFSRCLRCYACRQVCPACNCVECIFDSERTRWTYKRTTAEENMIFHAIRAFHVAGRCVECGECERACPMGIPLMEINKKVASDIKELFSVPDAGVDLREEPPLVRYETGDLDHFV
jgi:formate dehydrogenase subunit beta